MMAVKLLVKMAVMMMAPAALPWCGRGESPSKIGSISLFLSGSAFCSGSVSPFRIYMEIRNSDWPETFAVIFFPKISFLAAKEERQPPYGWLTRGGGAPRGVRRAPLPRDHLRHWFALIFLPNFPYFPKISSVRFYPVWTPFDMDILRNQKHATDRN